MAEVIAIKLCVLGRYGPYPAAGGACSGYLISAEGFHLLLDCGNGVLSRLLEQISFTELSAVIISHLHADHISDLMIMRYGLQLAFESGRRKSPLSLYAPQEPYAEFERLAYKEAYAVKTVAGKITITEGPFKISFLEGVHPVPSLAMRLETASGVLVYSSDTEYFSDLVPFAAGADLFLCEANYLEEEIKEGRRGHLSAAGAAKVASAAGVKKLLLTHLSPGRDPQLSISEAAQYYPQAELARERAVYVL